MASTISRGTVAGPQPSESTHRFRARLRLYVALTKVISRVDATDVLTVVALGLLFIGLAAPSAAFGVVGGLLVLLTPIGAALRLLIRGR